jgi:hypothetical protein
LHSTSEDVAEEIPLSLRVIDEVNDGKTIHVQAGVTAATQWNAEGVVAVLTALKDGVRADKTYSQLSKVLQGEATDFSTGSLSQAIIKPDTEIVFTLSVPADGVTDYQLELLWGEDAADLIQKSGNASGTRSPVLELRGLQVVAHRVQCSAPPCGSTHSISGTIVNSGGGVASSAVLGVGYLWVPQGVPLESSIPQSEEKMELALKLAPGKSRRFTFHLDQVVPVVNGGEYRPAVRLLGKER